jgi:hypothetical protein
MQTFYIEVKETLSQLVEVTANNEDEALLSVKQRYQDEEIILDADSHIATDFSVWRHS